MTVIVICLFVALAIFLIYEYPTGLATGFSKLPFSQENALRAPQSSVEKTKYKDVGEVNVSLGELVLLRIIKED